MSYYNGSVYTSEREPGACSNRAGDVRACEQAALAAAGIRGEAEAELLCLDPPSSPPGGAFLRRRISEQGRYQQSQDHRQHHKPSSAQQPTLLDRVDGQHSPGPTKESLEHDLRVLSKLRTDIVTGRHPFYKAPPGIGPDSVPQRPLSTFASRLSQAPQPVNGESGPDATGNVRMARPGRRDSRDVANDYQRQDPKTSLDTHSSGRGAVNDNSKRPFSAVAPPTPGALDGSKRVKTTDLTETNDIRARISEKQDNVATNTLPGMAQDAAEERPLVLRLDPSQDASEKEEMLRATSMRRSVSGQSASARSRSLASRAEPNRRESIVSVESEEKAALPAKPATTPSRAAAVVPRSATDVAHSSRKDRKTSPVAIKAHRKASPTIAKATPARAVTQDQANTASRVAGHEQTAYPFRVESDKARQDKRERERRRALPRDNVPEPPPRRDPSKFDKQRLPPAAGHPPRDAHLTQSTGALRDDDRSRERTVVRGRSDSDRQGARSPGPRDRQGRNSSPDRPPYGTHDTDQRTLSTRPGSMDGQSASRSAEADRMTHLSRSRSQQSRNSPPSTRISDHAPPAPDARPVHGSSPGAVQQHASYGRDTLTSKLDNRSAQLNGRTSPAPLSIQDRPSSRSDTARPNSAPVTKFWPPKDDPDRERPPPVKPSGKNVRPAERLPNGPKALSDDKGKARQLSPTAALNASSAKTPTLQDRIAQTAADARDHRTSPPRSARDIVPPPRVPGKPAGRNESNAAATLATSSANGPHMPAQPAVTESLFSRLNRSTDSGTMPPIQTARDSVPDRSARESAGRSHSANERIGVAHPADGTDSRAPSPLASNDRAAELSASALRNRISLPDQRQTDKGRQYDREREDRPVLRPDQRLDHDRRRSPSPVPSLNTSYSDKGRPGPPHNEVRLPPSSRERVAQARPPVASQRGHERHPSDIDPPTRDPFL